MFDSNPYITAAIFGIFTGLGTATGGVLVKFYIEPYIKRIRKAHNKAIRRAKKHIDGLSFSQKRQP